MTSPLSLTLAQAVAAVNSRDLSAKELTQAYLDRIAARQGAINAYVTISPEKALTMATESDRRVKEGQGRLLEGVPLGMKDLYCTEGLTTTAGSKFLENFVPPYESTVSANLWAAGGVCLGKTTMDEFAMGGSGETNFSGTTANPWDIHRTPGGSSSGSAAAVADWQCAAATGSDTGGSIRQPAHMCGVVGLKPTYGRCSRYGMVAFASSLDQAGPITRTVEDAALMLRAMAGHDERDSTSADMPVEAFNEKLDALPLKGLKIGLPTEYFTDALDATMKQTVLDAAKRFEAQGAELIEVSLPHTNYAAPTYYVLAPAEAASNLSRYDGMRFGTRVEGENLLETYLNSRSFGFGDEVKRRIMVGNYTLSSGYYDAYYNKAQQVRRLIVNDFTEAFTHVDVLLTPTAPTPAYQLGEKNNDPVQMYLGDAFTIPTSLAGLPGITVPAGMMAFDGATLPIGVQFIAPKWQEHKLLQVAFAHEHMTKFEGLTPVAEGA